jgi:membrane protease YdiL (CAAX protease family)
MSAGQTTKQMGAIELPLVRHAASIATSGIERLRARQKIAIFLVLVAIFSVVIDVLRVFVQHGANLAALTLSPGLVDGIMMWSVGLAGLLALVSIDRSLKDIGLRFVSPKYLILAASVPLAYGAAIYVPVWIFGLGRFGGSAVLFAGVLSALSHLPLHLLFAAGEEIGWRGVLVPNLARAAGFKSAALLPGAIWALWHYPDILFFGYNAGTPPLFALTCFSIALIGLGVFLSWLRLSSNSIWPAIIFHGVHNSIIWRAFDHATGRGAMTVYVSTEFGLGFAIAGAVIGCVYWTRLQRETKQEPIKNCREPGRNSAG